MRPPLDRAELGDSWTFSLSTPARKWGGREAGGVGLGEGEKNASFKRAAAAQQFSDPPERYAHSMAALWYKLSVKKSSQFNLQH